jgi:hypothetical protein
MNWSSLILVFFHHTSSLIAVGEIELASAGEKRTLSRPKTHGTQPKVAHLACIRQISRFATCTMRIPSLLFHGSTMQPQKETLQALGGGKCLRELHVCRQLHVVATHV